MRTSDHDSSSCTHNNPVHVGVSRWNAHTRLHGAMEIASINPTRHTLTPSSMPPTRQRVNAKRQLPEGRRGPPYHRHSGIRRHQRLLVGPLLPMLQRPVLWRLSHLSR